MKITLDKDACIGCGSCEAVCGELFEMGDDMNAHIKCGQSNDGVDTLKTEEGSCAKEGEEICPVDAIKIEE